MKLELTCAYCKEKSGTKSFLIDNRSIELCLDCEIEFWSWLKKWLEEVKV